MKRFCIIYLFLGIIVAGCSEQSGSSPHPSSAYHVVSGRNEGVSLSRPAVYRVKVPEGWTRRDPKPEESIIDSTKPVCEFFIGSENNQRIRITIHNFPVDRAEDRIPPGAQIARWKRQFTFLNPISTSVTPQSFGGFAGLLFEGSGRLNNEDAAVMGWAMQIAPEHYSVLSARIGKNNSDLQTILLKQMRADYTIKATGPSPLLKMHREAIIDFARSFELIQEIPSS